MSSPSGRVVDYLVKHGPTLEPRVVHAAGGGAVGEIGVFIAVLSGQVERVTLLDGADELRLMEGGR